MGPQAVYYPTLNVPMYLSGYGSIAQLEPYQEFVNLALSFYSVKAEVQGIK